MNETHPPPSTEARKLRLLRRGLKLEYATLGWNIIGTAVVLWAALVARSVALAGFGFDSLVEILASLVVVWQLNASPRNERRSLGIIGTAFILLALYVTAQSIYVLATGFKPHHSTLGIAWLALTAAVMFALASGKARTGRALGNRVLETESRVTLIDGYLAVAVLAGLLLNATTGWWWGDPLAGFVIGFYGLKEGKTALAEMRRPGDDVA